MPVSTTDVPSVPTEDTAALHSDEVAAVLAHFDDSAVAVPPPGFLILNRDVGPDCQGREVCSSGVIQLLDPLLSLSSGSFCLVGSDLPFRGEVAAVSRQQVTHSCFCQAFRRCYR